MFLSAKALSLTYILSISSRSRVLWLLRPTSETGLKEVVLGMSRLEVSSAVNSENRIRTEKNAEMDKPLLLKIELDAPEFVRLQRIGHVPSEMIRNQNCCGTGRWHDPTWWQSRNSTDIHTKI